ncbi:hypothetical protein IJ765_01115 [Candidatus Saccharibacteria bacterium]|nr:hypothetical protein [Candidatus Saccharibacteria bacterium]
MEYNGEDVTDLLNDDYSLDLVSVNENADIVVAFRPFYLVTDGDGGEHEISSGKDLAFVVDKDPTSYTSGDVTIMVDGQYIDLRYDSVVEPEIQTTTLLSSYLDTLAIGEHEIEIYFFDIPGLTGIARATFTVVEAEDETEDDSEDEAMAVPSTGAFTAGVDGAEATDAMTMILGGIVAAVLLFAIKKSAKRQA